MKLDVYDELGALGLLCIGAGLAYQFGPGIAAIVIGGLVLGFAVFAAWLPSRRQP